MSSQYIVRVFTSSGQLPDLLENDFFHSSALFSAFEEAPGSSPYMFVAYKPDSVCDDSSGSFRSSAIAGQLLAVVRRRKGAFVPRLFAQGRAYGEGVYAPDVNREEVFGLLLEHVTHTFVRRLCFYIEFSDLSSKMFGYRLFRTSGYFPVRWMQVTNDMKGSEFKGFSKRIKRQITRSQVAGTQLSEAVDLKEIGELYTMMRNYYRFKLQRILPRRRFFEVLQPVADHLILLTKYKDKVIGGCTVVFRDEDAYVWYMASRRKVYVKYHPNTMTVWHALHVCREHGARRLHFMNTGIPFRKNRYREFLLQFGGNPSSSYRWFRISIGWLNRLLKWIYRE